MFFTEQPYNTPKTKKLTQKKGKEKKKGLTALSPHGPLSHAISTFLFLLIVKSVHSECIIIHTPTFLLNFLDRT